MPEFSPKFLSYLSSISLVKILLFLLFCFPIFIATTQADPAPVVQTFFIEPSMQEKFTLDAILTVVDAQQILTRLDEQKPDGIKNEAEQQVLVCVTFFVICVIYTIL